jgi:hypothetical protein
MLKGQTGTDLEYTMSTIIFVFTCTTLFLEVLLPLIFLNYTLSTSSEQMRAIEFANIAESRMTRDFGNGNGDLDYERIYQISGIGALGLGNNYIIINSLSTADEWAYGSPIEGSYKHNIFTTIGSSYLDVQNEKKTVLSKGREYLIHIYATGIDKGSISFDIYSDYICSVAMQGGDAAGKMQSPLTSACSEITVLARQEAGESELRDMASTASNTGTKKVARIVPKNDIAAEQLIVAGMKLGSCRDASTKRGYECIRFVGDFVLPAKMHAEVARGSDFTSAPSDSGGADVGNLEGNLGG